MRPEDIDDDELTGETHLEATYRPNWGDGQIHLEGELDFPADQPAREVAASLKERAEIIGAIVIHMEEAGQIDAYPWNGPGFFRLCYDPDSPDARVDRIVVFDGSGAPAQYDTVDELIERGEFFERIADHIVLAENTDDDVDSQTYRITTDGLEPVDEE